MPILAGNNMRTSKPIRTELESKQERALIELKAIRTRVRRVLDAGERLDAVTQELENDLVRWQAHYRPPRSQQPSLDGFEENLLLQGGKR
jgi:hypothetical protein